MNNLEDYDKMSERGDKTDEEVTRETLGMLRFKFGDDEETRALEERIRTYLAKHQDGLTVGKRFERDPLYGDPMKLKILKGDLKLDETGSFFTNPQGSQDKKEGNEGASSLVFSSFF